MDFLKNRRVVVIIFFLLLLLAVEVIQLFQNQKQIELLQMIVVSSQAGGRGMQKGEDPYERSVKNQILKVYPEISALYKKYTAKNPAVKEGDVLVDFTIDTSGKAVNTQVVSSNFNDREFEQGIVSVIAKISFSEPVVKRYMTHTFHFKNEK